ncbi:60S ribosomal protein L17, partial [Ascosphaera acerosa]
MEGDARSASSSLAAHDTPDDALRRHLHLAHVLMVVRYAAQSIPNAKSARARGSYLRVSFKNTRETTQAISGMKLQRAVAFLENVLAHKEAVPMRRFAGSTGRTAQ